MKNRDDKAFADAQRTMKELTGNKNESDKLTPDEVRERLTEEELKSFDILLSNCHWEHVTKVKLALARSRADLAEAREMAKKHQYKRNLMTERYYCIECLSDFEKPCKPDCRLDKILKEGN